MDHGKCAFSHDNYCTYYGANKKCPNSCSKLQFLIWYIVRLHTQSCFINFQTFAETVITGLPKIPLFAFPVKYNVASTPEDVDHCIVSRVNSTFSYTAQHPFCSIPRCCMPYRCLLPFSFNYLNAWHSMSTVDIINVDQMIPVVSLHALAPRTQYPYHSS